MVYEMVLMCGLLEHPRRTTKHVWSCHQLKYHLLTKDSKALLFSGGNDFQGEWSKVCESRWKKRKIKEKRRSDNDIEWSSDDVEVHQYGLEWNLLPFGFAMGS